MLDTDTETGLTYHYRLTTPAADGSDLVVAYASAQRTVIGGLALAPAAPNPTSGDTRLAYRLPASQNVRITVHDVRGRLVRSLLDDTAGAGEHAVLWNGCDDQGRRAPAGVYFVNLQTGQGTPLTEGGVDAVGVATGRDEKDPRVVFRASARGRRGVFYCEGSISDAILTRASTLLSQRYCPESRWTAICQQFRAFGEPTSRSVLQRWSSSHEN